MASGGSDGRAATPGLSVKAIEDKLAKLAGGLGVWRDGLASLLGGELSAQFGLITESVQEGQVLDSLELQRAKVIWHLRRLADDLNQNEFRASARFAFNITKHRELRKLDRTARVKWGYERKLCFALTTVNGHMRKSVIPQIARELSNSQPVPLQSEIDAIIAEFRPETIPSEAAHSSPVITVAKSRRRRLRRLFRSPLFVTTVGGTVAAVLAAGILYVTTNVFQPSSPPPIGTGLNTTIVKVTDGAYGWRVVFPQHALPAAQDFLNQEYQPQDPEDFLSRELDAGAYVVGGILVYLNLESTLENELTIYNVRAVTTPVETPTGAFVSLSQAAGGTDYDMEFDLDTSVPVAKELLPRGEGLGEDFFSVQRIGLRKGEKATLEMMFIAQRRAYSFNIEIDYEVSGKQYRTIVQRNGTPFRVAPSPCDVFWQPTPTPNSGLPKYSQIRYNKHVGEGLPWRMVSGDLREGCQS